MPVLSRARGVPPISPEALAEATHDWEAIGFVAGPARHLSADPAWRLALRRWCRRTGRALARLEDALFPAWASPAMEVAMLGLLAAGLGLVALATFT